MIDHAFNTIDLVVLILTALSTIIGVLRGLTREILGVFGWVGAIVVVIYGLPIFRSLGYEFISNTMLSDAIVSILLFVISLSLLTLLNKLLSSHVKDSKLGGLDRSLGLVFGLARGAFLVCALFLIATLFYQNNLPESLRTARSEPYLSEGAKVIRDAIPEEFLGLHSIENPLPSIDPTSLVKHSIEETVQNLSTLSPISPQKTTPQENTNNKEGSGLGQLIEKL